jgi:hypothetical protein
VDARRLGRLAALFGAALLNSALAPIERRRYGDMFENAEVSKAPLFIIGHFRSGTTYLHDLMSLDDNFDSPSWYQAMFPRHFCMSQKIGYRIFDRVAPETRPMDNMKLRAAAPHEDEFALAGLCGISPYMRMLFPATGDDGHSAVDLAGLPPDALESWKKAMMHYMKKLTYWKHQKRIVLKSPPHMARIAVLLELFPRAQFIHIVRNPYEVFLSSVHLWKAALSQYHLQVPAWEVVEEIILSWYTEFFALFERDKPLLPSKALHEIKYEDLVKRPVEILQETYERLDIPDFDRFHERLIPYLESLKDYTKNVFHLDDAARLKVSARWRSTFDHYGYAL